MSEQSDFPAFLEAMRGLRLLHLGHKDADCDALGSAYAMSRVLPGDVGFAAGIKASARDLADWLELEAIIDPDPAAYDYTIIYDTNTHNLLSVPLPPRYALFDHHLPGSYRQLNFDNQLAGGAEWAWLDPLESTCSILAELFVAHGVVITRRMAVALAAGIVTDTNWLQVADAAALRRLAAVLEPSGLYLQEALAAIDSPHRQATRRSAVLEALRHVRETVANPWCILYTETDLHEHGFAVIAALRRLSGDVCLVAFPKGEASMVMMECNLAFAERTGIDLGQLAAAIATEVGSNETWGSPGTGRVVAAVPQPVLLDLSVAAVARALASSAAE